MPTAAKLFAAISFGLVGWVAAQIYMFHMPEGQPAGVLREVSALVGVLCGWFIMGPLAHRARSQVEAMGTGIRTSFTIVFFVLLIFACVEMFERAMKGRYDTPMDALLGVFERGIVLSRPLISPDFLGALLLGGLLAGAFAHWAGRTWR